jgi:uncharacterized protein YutE (UPF0331/DUF86 family)
MRVAFETRALRQYVATRPLRRIRWRYVKRRIAMGRYGQLESEAQTMVDVEVIQQRLGALEEFVSRLEEMRSHSLKEWREDIVVGKAGVLPADFAERFTAIVGFRNVLTELYVEVDPVKVYEHPQRAPDDIRFFARCIVEYLEGKGHLFL